MSVHTASKQGKRPQNEDKHVVALNLDKMNNMAPVNLFGVFDGHGGKLVSQYLYEHLPRFFTNIKVKYPIADSYIIDVFTHTQEKLKKKHPIASKTSGSTCLLVIQYKANNNEYLTIMNTGDSRAVICNKNLAIPVTKDHKPNWPDENLRIKKLGGTPVYDGFDWRIKDLSVSRAFGDTDANPYVTHQPDIIRYKLSKNDKFIILACDGLWDVLQSQDVVNYIISNCYDTTNIRINKNINIAKKLAEYAIQKGSTDNVTIIVVFF